MKNKKMIYLTELQLKEAKNILCTHISREVFNVQDLLAAQKLANAAEVFESLFDAYNLESDNNGK